MLIKTRIDVRNAAVFFARVAALFSLLIFMPVFVDKLICAD